MKNNRCYGCMQLKQASPVCEHCGYDDRTVNAPHQLPAGTVLRNQYLIGRVLGQGGFGITYLGWDLNLDISVAIKEYYPMGIVSREATHSAAVTVVTGAEDSRYSENRDRFLREARTLAKLEDMPEVVQVKNFFAENNTAYIIMGYVRGITLKEYMRRSGGKLSTKEAFRLLEPVTEALGRVHALDLVHRDISPDNIMLQPNGKARLIDFGAAHAATTGDKSTQAVLKHGFAPVEQYQSKGQLGPWTDVYAICATLYHCITGLTPPNATDRMMGEDDFVWDALQDLSPRQIDAFRQGLNLNHKQRIHSMEELYCRLFGTDEKAEIRPPDIAAETCTAAQTCPETEKAAAVPSVPESPSCTANIAQAPPISETGTVALLREESGTPLAVITPSEKQEQPSFTAPVEQSSYTAPITRKDSYTAPVEKSPNPPAVHPEDISAPAAQEPTAAPESKSSGSGMKKLVPIAAVAAVLVLALLLFLPKNSTQSDTTARDVGTAQPHISQPVPTDPVPTMATSSRILMNPACVFKEVTNGVDTWEEFDEEANYAFGTKVLRSEVSSITFLDTIKDAPADATDASQNQDGSVLAWVTPNGELYDLYLAADGKIIAPADCELMFAYYTNAVSIAFNQTFDTRNVENMNYMFALSWSIRALDLSGMNTSNARSMCGTFSQCLALEELDVSGFETKNVVDMQLMFNLCTSLKELDLSSFDTGNVELMYAMFYGCFNLSKLNVSGFDISKVWTTESMFANTEKLTNVNGNFDTHNVQYFESFMDPDDTFNGRPWEELFQ